MVGGVRKTHTLEQQRLQRERQRLETERKQREEEERSRRIRERREQFNRYFPNLRNHQTLLEEVAKSEEASQAIRKAVLSGTLERDNVQYFCDTYRGPGDEMITALLRSPKMTGFQWIALKIEDFWHLVLGWLPFLVSAAGFVL